MRRATRPAIWRTSTALEGGLEIEQSGTGVTRVHLAVPTVHRAWRGVVGASAATSASYPASIRKALTARASVRFHDFVQAVGSSGWHRLERLRDHLGDAGKAQPAGEERPDRDLVRPYRVGMSCGFCHVGPNPIRPPADPENPKWENLSSLVGAQYFWWDLVFNWMGRKNEGSFFYQALHVSRPGTLDTSLVSTDNITNPRTMNAVYQLAPRLEQALKFGRESLAGGSTDNKQFNDFLPPEHPLSRFYLARVPEDPGKPEIHPPRIWSPRVLKDGADSVGGLGALNRVYLNIGLFSEEWLLHFNPLVGGKPDHAAAEVMTKVVTRPSCQPRSASSAASGSPPDGAEDLHWPARAGVVDGAR